MKSIKEKAEEFAFIKQGIDPVGIQFHEFDTNKQDGFEAGANYVLETIEDIISNPRRYVSANTTVSEGMINDIVECVNKLKCN